MKRGIGLSLILILCIFSFISVNAEEQAAAEQAIALAESIKSQCNADAETCSCSSLPDEAKAACESEREKGLVLKREGMKKAEELKEKIKAQCLEDIDSCSCSEIEDANGKLECESAMQQAKYEADIEKQKIMHQCAANIESCDCSQVKTSKGKTECEAEKQNGLMLKEKIKSACEADSGACSCAEITNEAGKKECESKREEAQKQAGGKVIAILEKCFKNVDECNCNELELPKQEYVDFCEVEKNYGISCRDKGLYCDELESMALMPYGLPRFLEPIFKTTYKKLIENEKSKGAAKGALIMKNCILNPDKCDCSLTPTYAQSFCEQQKTLQLSCIAGNYDDCLILEKSPSLPEGMPKFSRGMFEQIADGARKVQEGIVKSNAAKKVGNVILDCMDSAEKCDCSVAPKGAWRAFCEHKKDLIYKCRTMKDYNSCFTLDEEPVITEDMPGFITSYVKKSIIPKVDEKKAKIYSEMKLGTDCQDIATLAECKKVYSES